MPRWLHTAAALLVALAMPLCCCNVRGLAALHSGDADAAERADDCCGGCCSQGDDGAPGTDDSGTPAPCPGGSGCGACCLKASHAVERWEVPVDLVGLALPPLIPVLEAAAPASAPVHRPRPDPQPPPGTPLRLCVLLLV